MRYFLSKLGECIIASLALISVICEVLQFVLKRFLAQHHNDCVEAFNRAEATHEKHSHNEPLQTSLMNVFNQDQQKKQTNSLNFYDGRKREANEQIEHLILELGNNIQRILSYLLQLKRLEDVRLRPDELSISNIPCVSQSSSLSSSISSLSSQLSSESASNLKQSIIDKNQVQVDCLLSSHFVPKPSPSFSFISSVPVHSENFVTHEENDKLALPFSIPPPPPAPPSSLSSPVLSPLLEQTNGSVFNSKLNNELNNERKFKKFVPELNDILQMKKNLRKI